MNFKEKKNLVLNYCNDHGCCNNEPKCPLLNDESKCILCVDEDYEKAYEILLNAGVFDDESTGDEDIINRPNHYTNGGMECIDEMLLVFGRETVAHFCLCNAWKYRYRALMKNGQEDIDKSHWYINKYKELVKGGGSDEEHK